MNTRLSYIVSLLAWFSLFIVGTLTALNVSPRDSISTWYQVGCFIIAALSGLFYLGESEREKRK